MSSDARFIAYRSVATNIVAGDLNQSADVFVFDRLQETTALVSANGSGNLTANRQSVQPMFSSNGRTLVFQSWASDAIGHDFNQTADLYAFQFLECHDRLRSVEQGAFAELARSAGAQLPGAIQEHARRRHVAGCHRSRFDPWIPGICNGCGGSDQ